MCTWPRFEGEGFCNSELSSVLSVCAEEEKNWNERSLTVNLNRFFVHVGSC